MIKDIQLTVLPQKVQDETLLRQEIARKLDVHTNDITTFRIRKKSIDARQRDIKINLWVTVYLGEQPSKDTEFRPDYKNVASKAPVIVVGSGPAGLFAALRLIELGRKPIVLERGKDVSSRKRDIALLNREHLVNPESNYCFGEGGAGTFSDGKLYSRSNKRGNIDRILQIFHFHGAQDEILYESHPHIGTDKLPEIIKNMRQTIIDCGGEMHFNTRLTDLIVQDDTIKGVLTSAGSAIACDTVILATGHSARDVYELLHEKKIHLESKPFAMGVRVEHPQELIDSIQYHTKSRGNYLPAASYSLVAQADGRGVYSFCMCPGGYIVPSATSPDEMVVNGMSSSRRHTPFANSGIVVEIRPEDFVHYTQHGSLAGLRYQQNLEQLALRNGGPGQTAPAQRLTDFVKGKLSATLPTSSYIPGLMSSPLHAWLPDNISKRLQLGFTLFDKKMHGFLTNEAYIAGVESRTSSPVRIPRETESLEHPQIKGLYPCGEGAGYAGGIVSSAMDGENAAIACTKTNI
ncbi:MAG: FAD-binding protein [Bacteroidota bacterium]|nr:FAD-binding protein [Bacteroidota bacterium]